MHKIFIIITFIFSINTALEAASPLAGVAGISGNNSREQGFARVLEDSIANAFEFSGVFQVAQTSLLKKELNRIRCIDEFCLKRFARTAGIKCIVTGRVRDAGSHMIINLKAFGPDVPYNGSIITEYRVRMKIYSSYSAEEYHFLAEEHAGLFLVEILKQFSCPRYFSSDKGDMKLEQGAHISGQYTFYHVDRSSDMDFVSLIKAGKVDIKNGVAVSKYPIPEQGDCILQKFTAEKERMQAYIINRKREIVIQESSLEIELLKMLFAVPASMSMPVAAPLLGYYQNSDWEGLALWTLNVTPYVYLEADGLLHDIDSRRSSHEDISKDEKARYSFGLYMFFIGGCGVFADAFAHDYLSRAREYRNPQPLIGSSVTTGFLSTVSGGGGHFYRGYRGWGYFYFHLNNILLYMTIREFSSSEEYNSETGHYEETSINKKRAWGMAAVYGAVKIIEVLHAVMLPDRLRNGEKYSDESSFFISPVFKYYIDEPVYGMALTANF